MAEPSTQGPLRRLLRRQETRFLLIGVYNTAFGYLVFLLVYWLLGQRIGPVACVFISYGPSLLSAFLLQKYWVFDASGNAWTQFVRFGVASTVILLANLAFLPLAIAYFGLNPPLAQAIFVVLSAITSFFAHRHFSFSR